MLKFTSPLGALLLGGMVIPLVAQGVECQRIINGEMAKENPGAAVILWDWTKGGVPQPVHIVGSASVVAPQWIMTANHCFPDHMEKKPWKYSFRVNSLKAREGGQQVRIDGWVYKNDIRLVHLVEPLQHPQPVKLAEALPPKGTVITTWGWGSDSMQSDQGIEDLKWCTAKVEQLGYKDYFGGPSYTSLGASGTAYKGDSGGPQFYNGEQVGVASTASPAASWMNYASVPANREWIMAVLNSPTLPPDFIPAPTKPPTWEEQEDDGLPEGVTF